MHVVTVDFLIHDNYTELFASAILKHANNSLTKEDDCLRFDVCRNETEPNKFFLFEMYRSNAAFENHMNTPHFQDFENRVAEWVKSKKVYTWNKLDSLT